MLHLYFGNVGHELLHWRATVAQRYEHHALYTPDAQNAALACLGLWPARYFCSRLKSFSYFTTCQ
jgi:hypothetical protein